MTTTKKSKALMYILTTLLVLLFLFPLIWMAPDVVQKCGGDPPGPAHHSPGSV